MYFSRHYVTNEIIIVNDLGQLSVNLTWPDCGATPRPVETFPFSFRLREKFHLPYVSAPTGTECGAQHGSTADKGRCGTGYI